MFIDVLFKSGGILRAEIDDDELLGFTRNFVRVKQGCHSSVHSHFGDVVFSSDCGPTFDLTEVAGFTLVYIGDSDKEE